MFGRLLDGALENVHANSGMTLAEGAVASHDGAIDAAETYEVAGTAGVGRVAPVKITSSANPVPEEAPAGPGAAPDSAGRPLSHERGAAMRRRAAYEQGRHGRDRPRDQGDTQEHDGPGKAGQQADVEDATGHTMRVEIEGCRSPLERILGDEVRSKNPRCVEHEIRLKLTIYNDVIDRTV